MSKFLDLKGLEHYTDLIKTSLEGKADIVDGKVPAEQLPSYVDDVVEFSGEVTGITMQTTGITKKSSDEGCSVVYNSINKQFVLKVVDPSQPLVAPKFYNPFGDVDNYMEADVPYAGKIYVDTTSNSTYRWSGSALVEISKSIGLGETSSTAYAGNKGAKNAEDIASIKAGDLPLVGLQVGNFKEGGLSGNCWTVCDGTSTIMQSEGNLTTIYGYSVEFAGNYMWAAQSGYKSPTAVAGGDWASKALPKSGVPSEKITVSGITDDKSITASVKAQKQGLVLVNGIIKAASDSDYDTQTASIKVHFQYKTIRGAISTLPTQASLQEMLAKANREKSHYLQDGKNKVLTGVTTGSTEYFVYAYPAKLGDLTKITLNDATPLLKDGFTKNTVTLTDPETKKKLTYNVYLSVQKGAFTEAKLDIS